MPWKTIISEELDHQSNHGWLSRSLSNIVPRERLFKVILRRAVASALSIRLQPSFLRNNQTEGTLGPCSLHATL